MRAFIAIEIPDDIKKVMAETQGKLKGAGVNAGWTRSEGIHLTLKFLGEVPESRTAEIMAAISGAARGTGGFRLEVAGAGAFPTPQNARVAWIGVSGEIDPLKRLQTAIEEAMTGLGFKREDKVFIPHLTLGRIKYIRSRDAWLTALKGINDIRLPAFDVHAVCLVKSELKPTGAVYTEVGRVELK